MMTRILAIAVAFACAAQAQRLTWYERLLLHHDAETISGIVVDETGHPVADAHIDHSDVQAREQLFTDDHGRFELRTRAPAVVVRKLGYNGELVRLTNARALRITLRRATRTLPVCSSVCRTLASPASVFCIPTVAGVQSGEQGRYEQTFVRTFTIHTPASSAEMLHGAGPSWTLGIPYTGDVWESADYSESAYTWGGSDIVDARGRGPAGKLWRYFGRFGESISYYEAAPAAAALFDRAISGVCASK